MEWTDEGIVLGVRRHGEASVILELMTREHGRHLGLVRGGAARGCGRCCSRAIGSARPGGRGSTSISAIIAVEGLDAARRGPVRRLRTRSTASPISAALCRLLPERDPHPDIYAALEEVLGCSDRCAPRPAPLVVRFELQLLAELGFGLDLDELRRDRRDRASWSTSRRSGPGGVARGRRALAATSCCGCRPFSVPPAPAPSAAELADGFALTGFFLVRHVFEPRGLALPDARGSFVNAILNVYSGAVAVVINGRTARKGSALPALRGLSVGGRRATRNSWASN